MEVVREGEDVEDGMDMVAEEAEEVRIGEGEDTTAKTGQ